MSTTAPAYTPTVADVAALIRARTKDGNGNELGTFTAATRPTEVQAQEAIDHAVVALHEKVGPIGERCAPTAQLAAAYGAAAEIELSYFPEQARTDRSPYQFLVKRYEALLEGVRACVLGDLPGIGPEGGPTGVGMGTLVAYSATAHGYYTGEIGVMGSKPPEPEPPIEPPPEGGGMPVLAERLNLKGVSVLSVPAGTTAINVSSADGTATLAGILIDGAAPPDGYLLTVRQVPPWPAIITQPPSPADEEALTKGSLKLQLNHPAAGAGAILELGEAQDTVRFQTPLVGWLLVYVAAHKGWKVLVAA